MYIEIKKEKEGRERQTERTRDQRKRVKKHTQGREKKWEREIEIHPKRTIRDRNIKIESEKEEREREREGR